MKNYLIQYLKGSRILMYMLKQGLLFKNIILFRKCPNSKSSNIFDYIKLSVSQPLSLNELVFDNNYYGIGFWIKEYIGSKKHLNAYIEHGLFLGSYVAKDTNIWYPNKVITFGDYREKQLIKKTNKQIIKIGPYIHYADDYIDETEFNILKKELGRLLLVFPSHPPTGASSNYDIHEFISEIEKIKNNYDTVVISLFYSEIKNQTLLNLYLNNGYKIFTSGNRYDPYFMSRQKTMIKLADMTISNKVGTHVGYCIFLEKPHWIFPQDDSYKAINTTGKQNMSFRDYDEADSLVKAQNEITQQFISYSLNITDSQIKVINKYWGLDYIKTKKELRKLLLDGI